MYTWPYLQRVARRVVLVRPRGGGQHQQVQTGRARLLLRGAEGGPRAAPPERLVEQRAEQLGVPQRRRARPLLFALAAPAAAVTPAAASEAATATATAVHIHASARAPPAPADAPSPLAPTVPADPTCAATAAKPTAATTAEATPAAAGAGSAVVDIHAVEAAEDALGQPRPAAPTPELLPRPPLLRRRQGPGGNMLKTLQAGIQRKKRGCKTCGRMFTAFCKRPRRRQQQFVGHGAGRGVGV